MNDDAAVELTGCIGILSLQSLFAERTMQLMHSTRVANVVVLFLD